MGDINKNKNQWNLPIHQPDPGLWEHIGHRLDTENTGNSSDQPIHSLPVHHPPSIVWAGIEKGVGRFSFAYFIQSHKVLITSIIAVLGLFFALWFIFDEGEKEPGKIGSKSTEQISGSAPLAIGKQSSGLSEKENRKKNLTQPEVAIPAGTDFLDNEDKQVSENLLTTVNPSDAEEEKVNDAVRNFPISEKSIDPLCRTMVLLPKTWISLSENGIYFIAPSDLQTGIGLRNNNFGDNIPGYLEKPISKKLFFGITLSPEYLVLENRDKGQFAWHADIQAGFKLNSGWFFGTGAGYAHYSCKENYLFNFQRNELLYKYTKVDSIIYQIDSVNMELHKDFVTSDVEIYDSIPYNGSMESRKVKSFVQIPVLAGYKFSLGKQQLYFKSGLLLSVLTEENGNGFYFNEDGTRVVSITQQNHCRLSTNWQFLFGAGITQQLGKKWSLAAEPQFRFYLNSPYTGSDGKIQKPWGINLRVGIYYNF